jgi:dTDP-4-amino-4,6-dideoxygalactose transaminase
MVFISSDDRVGGSFVAGKALFKTMDMVTEMKIPSTVPFIGPEEMDAVRQALASGSLTGNGPICRRVECQMQDMFSVKRVLLTPSCSHALEMAMLVLDVGPGDEVILPSFTFVSTANCVALRGAKPVFAEIKPDTLNIDPNDVARRITPRTKAIIPVHYAGVGCDMDAIMDLADKHDLHVVEDAAQGVDALYHDRYLGTIGHIGCYSFHGTKNITCGEGGSFLTNDEELAQRAEIIHEKGTNRAAFTRGQVDKYSWISLGSSYVFSDLLAAVLEAQIAKRREIKARRQDVWEQYYNGLEPLAVEGKLILPVIPPDRYSNYHIFFFRVANEDVRNAVLDSLRGEGIEAVFHYIPLHSSPFGMKHLGNQDTLPVTQECSRALVRLPLYPSLSDGDVENVVRAVRRFFNR